ncbi:MAG: lipocalin family protein [Rikenellaceae bacterium]|nr:lipocalin family protein [Rikenellaceae bacterium]
MKTRDYIIGGSILAVGGLLAATYKMRRSIPKNAEAVKNFDVNRYMGRWFEIARIDYMWGKNVTDTTADYTLKGDGSVEVINRGFDLKKGKWVESKGKAVFAGDPTEGRLKVSFFGPFYAGYNVIAVDNNYRYALVAGRNLDYLWLLSREQTMPEEIKQDFLRKAMEIGYDISKLVWPEHSENWSIEFIGVTV